MKRNCDMARDLMPLCIDGAASEESQTFVAAHVAECEACRDMYREMQESLPGTEDSAAQAQMNERVAHQLKERQRKRIGRTVLLGVLIGILVMVGLYALLSNHTTMGMPLERYTQTAYLRADGEHAVIVSRYQGKCSGSSSSMQPTEDGTIYYFELSQQRFQPQTQETTVELDVIDFSLTGCKELRQGSPQRYKTLWKRGEILPSCSAELEAYCVYLESMNRRIMVQRENGWATYYGLSNSMVHAEEQEPLILTEAEWNEMQAEGERLKQVVPELQNS